MLNLRENPRDSLRYMAGSRIKRLANMHPRDVENFDPTDMAFYKEEAERELADKLKGPIISLQDVMSLECVKRILTITGYRELKKESAYLDHPIYGQAGFTGTLDAIAFGSDIKRVSILWLYKITKAITENLYKLTEEERKRIKITNIVEDNVCPPLDRLAYFVVKYEHLAHKHKITKNHRRSILLGMPTFSYYTVMLLGRFAKDCNEHHKKHAFRR